MALFECPECSKEISDQAINCVHCGYPLPKKSLEDNDEIDYSNAPDCVTHINL